jgi:NitT/TauT family transport system ATP-binding protein
MAPSDVSFGLVFQNYRESLLPWRSVEDNIGFALELQGMNRMVRRERVKECLQDLRVSLPLDRYPYQLSGGQQQLVSILRSLIHSPDVLLLDEPFGSLDYRARLSMYDRIQDIFTEAKPTVVFVSHEIDEAILLSDRVLVLSSLPAKVVADIAVALPRPRKTEDVLKEEFLKVKRQVFNNFPYEPTNSILI